MASTWKWLVDSEEMDKVYKESRMLKPSACSPLYAQSLKYNKRKTLVTVFGDP